MMMQMHNYELCECIKQETGVDRAAGGYSAIDASQPVGAMPRRRGVQRNSATDMFVVMRKPGVSSVEIEIFQTEVGLISNFNYLIADKATLSCAVVDPAFEVDRLLRELASRRWRVEAILVTHTHHDHVDGVEALVQATGAPVYVGAGEQASLMRAAPSARIQPLAGGERLTVGGLTIEALPTPGHTIAGTSYVVDGNVFTGDTLFVGFCGRTDFPGGDAPTLWRSLQRLAGLPEETRVWPGHDYGKTPTSTIGWERASNPYLLCKSEEEFVALRTGKQAPRPAKK
jgi:glyoxylase-like metal-dependent hydrolase (beta-lactamase superfamily II)